MRKTIQVENVKEYCNRLLRHHEDGMNMSADFKMGVAFVLDHILNETGNYKGYTYQDNYDPDNFSEYQNWTRRYY
jgi:hypothetical protein